MSFPFPDSSKVVIPTLLDLAGQEISNGEMLARVQERHPEATLREIVRGALYAVSDPAPTAQERVTRIYDFALASRRMI
jgi:hypothetical protein